jgi:hypothetical protein
MSSPEHWSECEWALQELAARDGQLASAQRLQTHLASCPACRSAQAWDQRLAEIVSGCPFPRTPDGLLGSVRHGVRRRRLLQRATVAGAAAALLTLGFVVWNRPHEPSHPPMASPPEKQISPAPANDLSEWAILGSSPPVDPLDVLSRQQAAYAAVLLQIEKEF